MALKLSASHRSSRHPCASTRRPRSPVASADAAWAICARERADSQRESAAERPAQRSVTASPPASAVPSPGSRLRPPSVSSRAATAQPRSGAGTIAPKHDALPVGLGLCSTRDGRPLSASATAGTTEKSRARRSGRDDRPSTTTRPVPSRRTGKLRSDGVTPSARASRSAGTPARSVRSATPRAPRIGARTRTPDVGPAAPGRSMPIASGGEVGEVRCAATAPARSRPAAARGSASTIRPSRSTTTAKSTSGRDRRRSSSTAGTAGPPGEASRRRAAAWTAAR